MIRDNGEESEVCQACTSVLVDQDVGLDKRTLEGRAEVSIKSHTPFKSPWIIPWLCIYIKPLATSWSYHKVVSVTVAVNGRNETRQA